MVRGLPPSSLTTISTWSVAGPAVRVEPLPDDCVELGRGLDDAVEHTGESCFQVRTAKLNSVVATAHDRRRDAGLAQGLEVVRKSRLVNVEPVLLDAAGMVLVVAEAGHD